MSYRSRIVPFILFTACVSAQTATEEVRIRTLPKRFVSEELAIWSSPFRKGSYSSSAVKKYLIPFALVTGTLFVNDRRIADQLPNSNDQTRWSGRVSQVGAWYSVAGVGGATYLIGRFTRDSRATETGLLSLEALGHTQVAVFAIKQLSNRARPTDNDFKGGFWKGGTSFPSGHAASSFAVATVFAYEYRDHIAAPILAYSLAGLVSASRVGARRHWMSDIVAGGSMGFMIGRFTYKRNHSTGFKSKLAPQMGVGQGGPALNWTF